MTDKLKQLLALCKCGVYLSVNEHRDVYLPAADFLIEEDCNGALQEIPQDVFAKMVETDTIISIHFYPDTPIGFYKVYHYDLDAALDIALKILRLESAND